MEFDTYIHNKQNNISSCSASIVRFTISGQIPFNSKFHLKGAYHKAGNEIKTHMKAEMIDLYFAAFIMGWKPVAGSDP